MSKSPNKSKLTFEEEKKKRAPLNSQFERGVCHMAVVDSPSLKWLLFGVLFSMSTWLDARFFHTSSLITKEQRRESPPTHLLWAYKRRASPSLRPSVNCQISSNSKLTGELIKD